MASKKHKPEEIIGRLREVEIVLAQGALTAETRWRIAASDQTYYRSRKEYVGRKSDQAWRLKDLEKENQRLRRAISDMECPWYGSRQMPRYLRRAGHEIGRRRARRLMAKMGLTPIYQRPRTSDPHPKHRVYPYLLRELVIERPTICGVPT